MKRKVISLFLVLLALGGVAKWSHAEIATDRIVAAVNGDVILESDIKKQKQPVMRQLSNLPLGVIPPGKWPTEKEILDELVVMRLLEQEAAKKGIKIDDKNLDASIESIRKRQNLDEDQFIIFLSGNGLTLPEYKKVMRRQFTLTKLIGTEVLQKIPLSEEDAIQYFKQNKGKIEEKYQQVTAGVAPPQPPQQAKEPEIPTHAEIFIGGKIRLRQIVLKVPAAGNRKAVAKVMEKAKMIYREASTGADFAQLARKYSDDAGASSGGDLGSMNYKDMVPGLQKLVQRLKEGDVSPPLQTPNGLIIFYLAEAKNRTKKRVPIPEKERKEMEKQLKKAQEERLAQQRKPPSQKQQHKDEEGEDAPDPKNKPKIPAGALSREEEKEYLKVRGKVVELMKHDKIQSRMKDWIEELKKNAIIDMKL
jgi:peptidyl-prolyl cis-trans isomerase SurA